MTKETARLHDQNADEAIKRVKDGDIDATNLLTQWLKAYNQVYLQINKREGIAQ